MFCKTKNLKRFLIFLEMSYLTTVVFAETTADDIVISDSLKDSLFKPIVQFTAIAKVAGGVLLTLCLVAQGLVTFFGDNIPETIKKTCSRVATGGCFIGGASALAGFILG